MIYIVQGIGLGERSGSTWIHRVFKNQIDAEKCKLELNEICLKENLNAVYSVTICIVE